MLGCCAGSSTPRKAAPGRSFGPAPISLECKAAYHATSLARNGLGSASRPAYSRHDVRLLPKQLTAAQGSIGRVSRPAPTLLQCDRNARLRSYAARRARSGLGLAYNSLRSEAAAQAAHRRARWPRAGRSAEGPYLAGVQPRLRPTRLATSYKRLRLDLPARPYIARCKARLLLVQLTCSPMLPDCPLRRSSVAVHAVTVQRNRFTTM